MKVKELKEILSKFPDDTDIVVSSDAEGNNYSILGGYGTGHFVKGKYNTGELYCEEDYASYEIQGDNCVVLYP